MREEQSRALVATPDGASEKKEPYFRKVAARYSVFSRLLALVLVFFLVVFTLFFSRAFTYNSLFGFFGDLRALSAFVPKSEADIAASYATGECAVSYRGGVAFANTRGIEAYSPDGKCLFSAEREFASPRIAASRKYFLVFDAGGTVFSVCNAYAELYVGKSDLPILSASMADTGHFALITASDQALSAIELYNPNFGVVARFRRASATLSVSFTDNGKKMAILGMKAENGETGALLEVFGLGEENAEFSAFYKGELPVAASFTDRKNLVLLTESGMRWYKNGELKKETPLAGEVVAFGTGQSGAYCVLSTDAFCASHRILMTDKKGEITYDNGAFSGNVFSAVRTGNVVYLLTDGAVISVSSVKQEIRSYPAADALSILFADENGARVFSTAGARYISFTK